VAVKLVLVVRTDLGMGRGKVASQVAHAAVAAVLANRGSPPFDAWLRDGQPKVVLRAQSAAQLGDLAASARSAGLPVEMIHDAGRTQLAPGTPTCCALGPAEPSQIDAVAAGLRLL
jgi:PTH2 family peptidyl-tRNA hydrolase